MNSADLEWSFQLKPVAAQYCALQLPPCLPSVCVKHLLCAVCLPVPVSKALVLSVSDGQVIDRSHTALTHRHCLAVGTLGREAFEGVQVPQENFLEEVGLNLVVYTNAS